MHATWLTCLAGAGSIGRSQRGSHHVDASVVFDESNTLGDHSDIRSFKARSDA